MKLNGTAFFWSLAQVETKSVRSHGEQLAEHVGYSATTIRKYQIGMVLDDWVEAEYEDVVEQGCAMTMEQAICIRIREQP